jgi:membrane-bound ClpP family serine protease
MIAATRDSALCVRSYRQGFAALAVLLATALFLGATSPSPSRAGDAQDQAPDDGVEGLFITVQTPLTSPAANQVIAKTRRFCERPGHLKRKIVYDFNPDGHASATTDYGSCHDLAKFLLSLQGVTTVAFVHNDLQGHTVLPVLACKEIVMSKEARLGGGLDSVEKTEGDYYAAVARRRSRPTALVLKMVDKNINVVQGIRNGAVTYIDKDHETPAGFVEQGPAPVPPSGVYTAAEATKFGLCNLIRRDRQEVAEAYGLPPRSIAEDPLEGRTPVAWRIDVTGAIDGALRGSLQRRVRRAIHQGANLIILQLECGGGDTTIARDLADWLRTRRDDDGNYPVMTIAYVTERAHDNATFLAFGCSEIVMDQKATLGDFDRIIKERPNYKESIFKSLKELAQDKGYSPVLVQGMFYPEIGVHQVKSQKGQDERRFLTEAELDADKKGDKRWVDERLIQYPVTGRLAVELGVAQVEIDAAESEPLRKIADHYGLEVDKVHVAGPDWLDELGAFLRHPMVSVFLVMIGIVGLVLELKMPGIGLPGVVAALCFVLYFWAHSQLGTDLSLLAILLFVLGLILIGLEVFVVPGLGITGVSGIVLVIVSLALATLVHKPETTHEWLVFGTTLSTLGISLVSAIVVALVLAWYLPHIPWANRLVLAPPSEGAGLLEEEEAAAAAESMAALLGAMGEAATDLRPAGKARFGDDYLDVVAEGSYVMAGARVQVIEIEGNRVVVKEV